MISTNAGFGRIEFATLMISNNIPVIDKIPNLKFASFDVKIRMAEIKNGIEMVEKTAAK